MIKGIEEINQALKEYVKEVQETMDETFKRMADKSVDKLAQTSPRGKSHKHYADRWAVKETPTGYIVHNKDKYQLTHLLEYGHVKRNGKGRVNAQPHIKPVEDWIIDNVESRLKRDIEN